MQKLYIGIDVGAKSHHVTMMDSEGNVIMDQQVKQSIREVSRFIKQIRGYQEEHHCKEVLIGMEGSRGYAAPMDRMLVEAGFSLVAINSATIDKYRKLVGQARKDDRYDASLIATYLIDIYQLKNLKHNAQVIGDPNQSSTGKLRIVTRHYRTTKRDLTRVTNRLRKHLLGYFPDFLEVFKGLQSKTARLLLKQVPTIGKIKRTRETTLANLPLTCKRRLGSKAAAKLKALVHDIEYVDPLEAEMARETRDLVNRMELLLKQIEVLQQQIAEMAEQAPIVKRIAATISGAGILNTAEIVAEIGDVTRFATRDKLSVYCGIGCLNNSSGKKIGSRKVTQCNHYAKGAICMLAQSAMVHDAKSRTYYRKKRNEGKHHWHAIKCLAKYLLRHIYEIMQTEARRQELAMVA